MLPLAGSPGGAPALIQVDHSATFPASWAATIRPTLNLTDTDLYVEWEPLPHPDVDNYLLYIGTSPLSPTQIITAGSATREYDDNGQPLGDPVGFATVRNVEPNQTYYLSVAAQNRATGQVVRSAEISLLTTPGNFSLTTPAGSYPVVAGGERMIPLKLVIAEPLFYPQVSLAIDLQNAPAGLNAWFANDEEGLATLSAANDEIEAIISVAADVPAGRYPLIFKGYNGSLVITAPVEIEVGEGGGEMYLPIILK